VIKLPIKNTASDKCDRLGCTAPAAYHLDRTVIRNGTLQQVKVKLCTLHGVICQ
jgi:hypothetical protein